MNTRMLLTVILIAWAPISAMASGEAGGQLSDPNSELALRLFAEREWARGALTPYVFAYPHPGQFSAQALEQQNRAQLYWLWQPNKFPGWQAVPYWPSACPVGWPIITPWMPSPVPTR